MFLTIGNVLHADKLEIVRNVATKLKWRDGADTAGPTARKVKRNQQADLSDPQGKALHDQLMAAINANTVLQAAARPAKFSRLLLSRTSKDGGYGAHVDNAIMGAGDHKLRTDLSFTLFLSDPEAYEGGALMLDLPGGQQSLKPQAGELVLYPSTLIHAVEPVSAGERLVAVGWIQSQIRHAEQRQILFDLEQVRSTLRAKDGTSPEALMLDKAMSNLLRQWTDI